VSPEPGDLRGRSLLAVFAHPDDESLACGGLLAWAAQLGARVSLLCATHGEHGPGQSDENEPLGAVRARELKAAARILGIAELVLLDYPDGSLSWDEASALEAEIGSTIRRLRPDVVITFGADGLYWHPDHIAIHERTTAAVAGLGEAAPALYYVTMPPGSMRAVAEQAGPSSLILGIADADAFGADAAAPTLVVDAGAFAVRKLAAIRCHRTQLAEDAFALIAERDAARFLGIEHFHRAAVGSRADAFIDRFAAEP
jgi:LmbE family N-acetylglucosaminyl deacetylase